MAHHQGVMKDGETFKPGEEWSVPQVSVVFSLCCPRHKIPVKSIRFLGLREGYEYVHGKESCPSKRLPLPPEFTRTAWRTVVQRIRAACDRPRGRHPH